MPYRAVLSEGSSSPLCCPSVGIPRVSGISDTNTLPVFPHWPWAGTSSSEPSLAPAPQGCCLLPPPHLQLLNPAHPDWGSRTPMESTGAMFLGKELQQHHSPLAPLLTVSWDICADRGGRGSVLLRLWAEHRGSAGGTDPSFLGHWHTDQLAPAGAQLQVKERTSPEVACPRFPCQGDKSFCDHFYAGSSIQTLFHPPTGMSTPKHKRRGQASCLLPLPGSFTPGEPVERCRSDAGAMQEPGPP